MIFVFILAALVLLGIVWLLCTHVFSWSNQVAMIVILVICLILLVYVLSGGSSTLLPPKR